MKLNLNKQVITTLPDVLLNFTKLNISKIFFRMTSLILNSTLITSQTSVWFYLVLYLRFSWSHLIFPKKNVVWKFDKNIDRNKCHTIILFPTVSCVSPPSTSPDQTDIILRLFSGQKPWSSPSISGIKSQFGNKCFMAANSKTSARSSSR